MVDRLKATYSYFAKCLLLTLIISESHNLVHLKLYVLNIQQKRSYTIYSIMKLTRFDLLIIMISTLLIQTVATAGDENDIHLNGYLITQFSTTNASVVFPVVITKQNEPTRMKQTVDPIKENGTLTNAANDNCPDAEKKTFPGNCIYNVTKTPAAIFYRDMAASVSDGTFSGTSHFFTLSFNLLSNSFLFSLTSILSFFLFLFQIVRRFLQENSGLRIMHYPLIHSIVIRIPTMVRVLLLLRIQIWIQIPMNCKLTFWYTNVLL